jgi:DNA-binding transcriptional ArsR family regulator
MSENVYDAIKSIFHEPSRLAIMSTLAAAPNGLSFTELRTECELTDGNLSRHLRALEDAGAVRIRKRFVGVRPRTDVCLSAAGRDQFVDYLTALEDVLRKAAAAIEPESPATDAAGPMLGEAVGS